MTQRITRLCLVTTLTLGLAAEDAPALINPQFTPVHVVNQSETIVQLRIQPESGDGRVVFAVEKVLKGKYEVKSFELDLTASESPDQAKFVDKVITESSDKLALMFIGEFAAKPDEAQAANGQGLEKAAPGARRAYVHLEGHWIVLVDDKGTWKFEQVSQQLVQTWNGGTDMLLRAVKYILEDAAPEVPVRAGATWGQAINLGKIAGKRIVAAPVDLNGTGVPLLFVASDGGDKLFACRGGVPEDLTAKCKLQSKSLAFAWADFNGDGRLDLASWDGKALTIYVQAGDGTFAASAGAKELAECIGLSALDVGTPGKAGLLISTRSVPMLLSPAPDAVPQKLEAPAVDRGAGTPGPCLVADFNDDGIPDIVQPASRGGVFYAGKAAGIFAAPVACDVASGEAPGVPCVGDWDADGKLDIFTVAADRCRLWQNQGGGKFADMTKLTGELSYVSKPNAIAGFADDLNNDGRQDITILYASMAPQVFFSRGFRSFGFSTSMSLSSGDLLPGVANGQVAGCVADFTGAGAQDLAVVLNDGRCAIAVRAPSGADLCARVIVSPKSPSAGPVKVWAKVENRALGAWNIAAGSAPAFIARADAGPVTIGWQFPGQPAQTREVVLENKPVNVVIDSNESRK